MKINARTERLFSHAAALHQSGRLKNTVYCTGSNVLILNQDHTVLLRFTLRDKEQLFAHPVSFNASDYDSQELSETDGCIEFVQRDGDFVRTKSCSTPKYTPDQVMELFLGFGKPSGSRVKIPASVQTLLDESMSHIEFSARKGKLHLVQRNIYTGAIITVEQVGVEDGASFALGSEPLEDFGPLGMRTDDFLALFSFAPSITFWFGSKDVFHFKCDDPDVRMMGVVSQCVYDEMGGILKTE